MAADPAFRSSTPSRRDMDGPTPLRQRTGRFTREKIVGFLKTLAWVAPLTVLTWVYAEREQEVPDNVQIFVQVKSTDPTRIATLKSPKTGIIACTLQGPRSQLDQFKQTLASGAPLVINIDSSIPTGESGIDAAEKIQDSSIVHDRGIAVEKCSPPILDVLVDTIENKTGVPVEAPPDLASLDNAVFNPPTVTLRGPHQELAQLEAGHLAVFADIAGLPILSSPGTHLPVAVPLKPVVADGSITTIPATVQATLVVKAADVSLQIPNLPVFVSAPPGLEDQYSITPNPKLANVTLVGQPDKIAAIQQQITSGTLSLVATLRVDSAAALTNPKSTALTIDGLPPGVTVDPKNIPHATPTGTLRG